MTRSFFILFTLALTFCWQAYGQNTAQLTKECWNEHDTQACDQLESMDWE